NTYNPTLREIWLPEGSFRQNSQSGRQEDHQLDTYYTVSPPPGLYAPLYLYVHPLHIKQLGLSAVSFLLSSYCRTVPQSVHADPSWLLPFQQARKWSSLRGPSVACLPCLLHMVR